MLPLRTLLAAALVLTAACKGKHATHRKAPPVEDAAAAPAPTAYHSSTEAAAIDADTVDCQMSHVTAHADGVELVREMVTRDAGGDFLGSNTWWDGALQCPGHAPAPDAFTVVSRYQVVPLKADGGVVRVAVRYREIGTVENTGTENGQAPQRFEPAPPRTVDDTLVAVRTPFGWRVREPVLPPRVLASAVARRPSLSAADQQAMLRAAARADSTPDAASGTPQPQDLR